jgi:hypothetical protein
MTLVQSCKAENSSKGKAGTLLTVSFRNKGEVEEALFRSISQHTSKARATEPLIVERAS